MLSSATAFFTLGRYRPGPAANWDHNDEIDEVPDELAHPPPAYFRHRRSRSPQREPPAPPARLALLSRNWETYENSAREVETLRNTYSNSLHQWTSPREAKLVKDNIDMSTLLSLAYRELYRINSELERLERIKRREERERAQREENERRHSYTGMRAALGGL